jgi:hypothetical protein
MPKKLTNKDVDNRLIQRQIKRIDDYQNKRTPINFQCLICGHIWKVSPEGVLKGTGCPSCSGHVELTDDIIDERLKKKNIIRISNSISIDKKITLQCMKSQCGYVWKIKICNVSGNHGCPKCAHCAKLSLEEVNNLLKDRFIRMISPYINISTRSQFICLACNYTWKAKPNSVIHNKTGCKVCSGKLFTNEIIDKKLEGRELIRIENYAGAHTAIKFKCIKNNCNYIWKAAPHEVVYAGQNCPKCGAKSNEKLIYTILTEYNIEFNYHHKLHKTNTNYHKFVVDFYISSINTIIEYNGDQHYRPVRFGGITKDQAELNFQKQVQRDKFLEKYCADNKINLIWIDGRIYKYGKLNSLIRNKILPYITGTSNEI